MAPGAGTDPNWGEPHLTPHTGHRGVGPLVTICLALPPELQTRRQLSCSEDSDLSSDDVLERTSQKSKKEVGGPWP